MCREEAHRLFSLKGLNMRDEDHAKHLEKVTEQRRRTDRPKKACRFCGSTGDGHRDVEVHTFYKNPKQGELGLERVKKP